jgi:predicted permease
MYKELATAVRRLCKSPGFLATALVILGLCVGANLAIYAVVDGVLIRPLPFPNPDRLVNIYYTYPRAPTAQNGASLTTYYERRGKIRALSTLSEISESTSVIGEKGATSIEQLGRVTPEFFETLGVTPLMGRFFNDSEMTYQSDHVAVLSYEYWKERYNADPSVLGKTIRMDGLSREIVGILPRGFRFLSFEAPVYMPLSSEEGERNVGARHSLGKIQVARLARGATLAEAQAQIDADDAAHAPEFSDSKIVAEAGCRSVVAPLQADFVASVRPTLVLLQAGALVLFAIGGVNLANLFLIRASHRVREFAIRRALGASGRQIFAEVLTETLVVAVFGGALGILAGSAGIRLLSVIGASRLPLGSQIEFNGRIAAAALLASVASGALIGSAVAWFSLRSKLLLALQAESRSSTGSSAARRLRHGFIVAQIALAFVLLTSAGLLGLSLRKAMSVSPGFHPDHVVTGRFSLTWSEYHDNASYDAFFTRLVDKGSALPGVTAFAAASNIPILTGDNDGPVTVPGRGPAKGGSIVVHDFYGLTGSYFAAMGIPLVKGRFLAAPDLASAQHPCVVDQTFAACYWPDGDVLGRQFYRGTDTAHGDGPYTIVGVVGDVKQAGLTNLKPRGAAYFPYTQLFTRTFFVVARTANSPESVAAELARVLREIDPDMPLTDLRTMELRIDDSLATRRSPVLIATAFSLMALALAAVGLYGAMAYGVAQRTREFGVRLALGAGPANLIRLVLGEGLRLFGLGAALGVLLSLACARSLSALLFSVDASDPVAFGGVAAALGCISLVACLLPAVRAVRVDPMVSLRSE